MWEAALNPLLHPRARAAPASGTDQLSPPPTHTFIQQNQYQNILPHPHFHPPKFGSPHCFTNLNLNLVGESIPKSAPKPTLSSKISGLFERATQRKHTIVPGEVICGKPHSILCFIQEPELRPHPALTSFLRLQPTLLSSKINTKISSLTHTFIHPNLLAPIIYSFEWII